jgi:hypothetical protein
MGVSGDQNLTKFINAFRKANAAYRETILEAHKVYAAQLTALELKFQQTLEQLRVEHGVSEEWLRDIRAREYDGKWPDLPIYPMNAYPPHLGHKRQLQDEGYRTDAKRLPKPVAAAWRTDFPGNLIPLYDRNQCVKIEKRPASGGRGRKYRDFKLASTVYVDSEGGYHFRAYGLRYKRTPKLRVEVTHFDYHHGLGVKDVRSTYIEHEIERLILAALEAGSLQFVERDSDGRERWDTYRYHSPERLAALRSDLVQKLSNKDHVLT